MDFFVAHAVNTTYHCLSNFYCGDFLCEAANLFFLLISKFALKLRRSEENNMEDKVQPMADKFINPIYAEKEEKIEYIGKVK